MEFLICLGIAILVDILLIIAMWIFARIMEWEYRTYLGIGIVLVVCTTILVAITRKIIRDNEQAKNYTNQISGEYKISDLLEE